MPVAQLVEHLTFNQGVRDSNSRGRTKKHQTNFCPVLFCCVITPIQNRLAKILSVPVATMAGNNAQGSTTRWQYAPASAAFLEYIRSRLGDAFC